MVIDAAFWATVALVLFIALVLYLKVPAAIGRALDGRIKAIETELAEAERLRAEAQALLDSYARRRSEAEAEAAGIVSAAKDAAVRMTAEASASLEQLITRRTKSVEDKIAQAEAQALAEVRARSADVAVEAARLLLSRQVAEKGDALVERSIGEVASKLN